MGEAGTKEHLKFLLHTPTRLSFARLFYSKSITISFFRSTRSYRVCVSDLFWAAGCCLVGWEGRRLAKDLHLDWAYWTAGAPQWLWSALSVYPSHQSPLSHWLWGALLTSRASHDLTQHQLQKLRRTVKLITNRTNYYLQSNQQHCTKHSIWSFMWILFFISFEFAKFCCFHEHNN